MALRNNSGEQITIDSRLTTTEVTNVRSNTTALTSGAYSAVSTLTNYVRNVTDSALEVLMDIAIGDICNFNEMNYRFMERLMYLNDNEVAITLKNIGANAAYNGDSTAMSTERLAPEYAKARNYIDNYAKNVTANELKLQDTTRALGNGSNDYKNHGQLYFQTTNLYPNENDSRGIYSWNLSGAMDATLHKTKQLFNQNKINTIISRFHTNQNSPQDVGDIKSSYGLSHSRNLLTKNAEMGLGSYSVNGYDRPYCRVWTHHYEYDKLNKRIRPFYITDEYGNTSVITLKNFHVWKRFEDNGAEWGWKSSKNDGWKYSVLNDNGMPNITPIYNGGGSMNIHTKQCMFSIENLAWQGFSPYAFEKNLSWEQRGPLGGRIMWFPPYGIHFNETTTASWQSHTFIGRGEDVYTYTNTKRTGTLSFMLVVDHPSILDYSNWDSDWLENKTDTDILRFLAGCEAMETVDGTGQFTLRDIATPTPLTDEYMSPAHEEENLPAEPQNSEPEEMGDYIALAFCVFYPNNYAGYYDVGTNVEPMAYLLAGKGAQKVENSTAAHPDDSPISFEDLGNSDGKGYEMLSDSTKKGTIGSGITYSCELDNLSENKSNFIQGTQYKWSDPLYTSKEYLDGGDAKKWYYRIDGKYDRAYSNEQNRNTYDQVLKFELENKKDSQNIQFSKNTRDWYSFGLNCNAQEVMDNVEGISKSSKTINIDGTDTEKDYETTVVSFAEIAYVLASSDAVKNKLKQNAYTLNDENNNNIKLIEELLENYKSKTPDQATYVLENIEVKGVANNHGNSTSENTNKTRNEILSDNRAISVKDWLGSLLKGVDGKNIKTTSGAIGKTDDKSISAEISKVNRRAEVRIFFKKADVTATIVADTDQTEKIVVEEEGESTIYNGSASLQTSYVESRVVNGIQLYINPNETDPEKKNLEWFKDDTSGQYILYSDKYIYDRSNYGNFRANKGAEDESGLTNGVTAQNGNPETNKLRYDQEYHFFKYLEKNDPMVFDSLKQKLRYFDPAFHAQSPESFNSRLTFLQQCLRQGPTVGASDKNATSANNLAFGRPPVCVLRLGDFFNCKIIIENMSISYDPLVWDLNTEGIGVQPMIATVNLSFYFTGGSDIRGAITRLQNAVSFNYYGNTSLYDNRADRVYRNYSQESNGAIDHEIVSDRSYFYDPEMQNSGDF